PLLMLDNYYKDVNGNVQQRNLTHAYFGNCIIYGNLQQEIGLDYKTGGAFDYMFDFCLYKSDSTLDAEQINFPAKFTTVIKNSDPAFTDVIQNDYSLTSSSPAIDAGSAAITNAAMIVKDIKGNAR